MDTLEQIQANVWTSAYVQSNPSKSYKHQHEQEYLEVAEYINGGARPDPTSFSKIGKALVGLQDHVRGGAQLPDPELPYVESVLRPGFASFKVGASETSLGGVGSPIAGGNDVLLDCQKLQHSAPIRVYGGANQRIHLKDVKGKIDSPRTTGATSRSVLRLYAADATGPEKISATGVWAMGTGLCDAVTWDAGLNTDLTLQKLLIEPPAGNQPEPSEHVDAIQCQGEADVVEIGLATIGLTGVVAGNDRGKGLMLNRIDQRPFVVKLNKVNFLAGDYETGAAIFASYPGISVIGTDVWFEKLGNTGNKIFTGSGAFYPQNFTVVGGLVSWPAGSNMQLIVRVGRPPGGNYVTGSMLS